MPIKLDKNLPAYKILQDRGVFMMSLERAESQDIRPLRIGILNLMPKKEETEVQLLSVIGDTPLQVEPILIRTTSYTPKNVSKNHLNEFYVDFETVKKDGLDGLIITGAPVELLEFDQVKYWRELVEIMDWARSHVTSTLHLCWGAQAGLFHHYGIQKHTLDSKKFGVFNHKSIAKNDTLLKDIDDEYWVPHSRHTEVKADDVDSNKDLDILSYSERAGLHLVANKSRSLVFQFGHPEYEAETLRDEYMRDKAEGKKIELPENYFHENKDSNQPVVKWRANASIFYRNWINHIYQTTPYDLSTGK